jgi:hypothetical protein
MNFENFKKTIEMLRDISEKQRILYKNGIDLINFSESYDSIISMLFEGIYGTVGNEWIGWFCYENDFGRGKLKAYDGDIEIIKNIDELWKYLEDNHSIKKYSSYCSNCKSSKENCVCKFIKK